MLFRSANVIMADFARRAALEFAKDGIAAPVADAPAAQPEAPVMSPVAPLQAGSLFWVVVKAYCLKFLRVLGLAK